MWGHSSPMEKRECICYSDGVIASDARPKTPSAAGGFRTVASSNFAADSAEIRGRAHSSRPVARRGFEPLTSSLKGSRPKEAALATNYE